MLAEQKQLADTIANPLYNAGERRRFFRKVIEEAEALQSDVLLPHVAV
jgi:hypothetical protein